MALPGWLARRLPLMKKSGKFNVSGERNFDARYLSSPEVVRALGLVKHVDLSRTPLETLEGLPNLPHLSSFSADQTQISKFTNFKILQTAASVSFKGTPLSELPTYHIGLLLVLGIDSLSSIDGKVVPTRVRRQCRSYPAFCGELVNRGWIPEFPCPDGTELLRICERFEVEPEFPSFVPYKFDAKTPEDVDVLDFEELVKKLKEEHEDVMVRGQALFGIINREDEFAGKVAEVLRSHGVELPNTTDGAIAESVRQLCNGSVAGSQT